MLRQFKEKSAYSSNLHGYLVSLSLFKITIYYIYFIVEGFGCSNLVIGQIWIMWFKYTNNSIKYITNSIKLLMVAGGRRW